MESINPKDFYEIDLSAIEYFTLKNGNMVMLDENAPEKKKNSKKPHLLSSPQKNISLIISEPINISYKSLLKPKPFKDNTKIIFKNDNFFIKNEIQNKNLINVFNKKYNLSDINDIKNKIDEIDKLIIEAFIERIKMIQYINNQKNNQKNKSNINIYELSKENEILIKQKKIENNIDIGNDIENLFNEIIKLSKKYQNKEQKSLKILNNNYINNHPTNSKDNKLLLNDIEKNNNFNLNNINIINKNNNEKFMNLTNISPIYENINNLNSDNANNSNNRNNNIRNGTYNSNIGRRERRFRTFDAKNTFKFQNKIGRNKNVINAVCSLNIPSDIEKNINLIEKFNNLVDVLNNKKIKLYKEQKELEEKNKSLNIKNNKQSNINEKNKSKKIRKNIFNICEKQNNIYQFNSQLNNIFNKTKKNEIRNNISEYKIKFEKLKTNRTYRYNNNNNNKFLKYKKNNSSIVLPSNIYYY